MKNKVPIEVSEAQRAAALARQAKMTPAERIALGKLGFAARCAKYRQPPVNRPYRQPVQARAVHY